MAIPTDPPLSFVDLVRGPTGAPSPDDQVLMKADGYPTYHLAVVVDDHDMGITHIIRGEEWISSTPKHILLYEWFGWTAPEFAHVPLLRNTDRSKISKRKNPAARLQWFHTEGYLPQALVNFLALMGYSPPDSGEIFTLDELIESFELAKINTVGPVFDLQKLAWLNGHYLRQLTDEQFLAVGDSYLPSGVNREDLRFIIPALRERTKRLCELPEQVQWLATDTIDVPLTAIEKSGLPATQAASALSRLAEVLAQADARDPAAIEAVLDGVCADLALTRKRFFMTVRLAVVGQPVSPPLHETLASLGSARAVARLREAQKALAGST
jgi:glutamyl-tRNA synthetase